MSLLLILPALLGGCVSTNNNEEDVFTAIQRDYDDYLKERTPEGELRKNLEKGELPFYCYGSLANGYRFPGLSEEQHNKYIKKMKIPAVLYWRDDPILMTQPHEPFDSMLDFLHSYNLLVIEEIERKAYQGGGHNSGSSAASIVTP